MTPIHQWTNGGDEVLLVKCVDANGNAYGGFQWPLHVGSVVTAPDWEPVDKCGGGLHGWPWGKCLGVGRRPDFVSDKWLIFGAKPEDLVAVE